MMNITCSPREYTHEHMIGATKLKIKTAIETPQDLGGQT